MLCVKLKLLVFSKIVSLYKKKIMLHKLLYLLLRYTTFISADTRRNNFWLA